MRKRTLITTFAQECAILVDQGEVADVQLIKDKIESRNLIYWLKETYMSNKEFYLAVNSFEENDISYLHDAYYDLLMGYYDDSFRKWGIENNGFNLLVTWGIELSTVVNENEKV